MRRPMRRLGIAVALASLAMVGAACSSTGSTPSSSTVAAPQDLASKRYDFRVTLTKAWKEVDAAVDWDGNALKGIDAPDFAKFTNATTGRTLMAAALPVGAGTKLVTWRATMVGALPSDCSNAKSASKTSLDREPAMTWPAFCDDGLDVESMAALHGQRGYIVLLASPTQNGAAADHVVFESIRRSFRFGR